MATANPYASLDVSTLQVQDPSDFPLAHQFVVPFGHPGTGKSTLAAAFPNHLYIDLEGSAAQLAVRHMPAGHEVTDWSRFRMLVEAWHEAGPPKGIDTLVIDTCSKLYEMCADQVRKDNGWANSDQAEWGGWWVKPREEFKRYIGMLRQLHERNEMGTVLVCHEINLTKTEDGVDGTFPDAGDKRLHKFVAAEASLVMRTTIADANPVTMEPFISERGMPESRFIAQVKGSSNGVTKDRSGRLPSYVPTDYQKIAALYEGQ